MVHHWEANQPSWTQTAAPGNSPSPQNVLTVNLSLNWKHLTAIWGGIIALVGAMIGAGWLVLPAKQTELDAVQRDLVTIKSEMNATRGDILQVRHSINDLVILVNGIDNTVRNVKIDLPARGR